MANTNYECIKNMSVEEMAELITGIFDSADDNTITKWFERKYCDNCPTEKITACIECPSLVGEEFHECDFQGICPHYKNDKDKVRLWLESEVEE